MAHKYQGPWSFFEIKEGLAAPGPPDKGADFVLYINSKGDIDPDRSTVAGVKVQTGKADDTATTKTKALDITDAKGRHYVGFFVKEFPTDDGPALVIQGHYKDPAPLSPKTKAAASATGQDEGDWVLTKP